MSKQPKSPSFDSSGDEFSDEFLEENEPYLGPAWAVVMLILYLLKEAFPAEEFSLFWWFQMYIIALVVTITIFTLVKRYQFYKSERLKDASKEDNSLEAD